MKITVTDDNDEIVYSYDTDKNAQCLFPGEAEKPGIIAAVEEALNFLVSIRDGNVT